MSNTAKWILGGLGFVLGGPIGALVGVLIGSLIPEGVIKKQDFTDNDSNTTNEFESEFSSRRRPYHKTTTGDIHISLLVLIAAVMKADGHLKRSELELVKRFLLNNYGEQDAKQLLQVLKQLLEKDIDVEAVADQIRVNVNYSTRLEIIHFLLDLANADGEFLEQESNVIETIYLHLGISQADYLSILAPYKKQKNPNWVYQTLEINPDATNEEVKKAYRRMAMKYHPDKVTSAGEDIKQKATEKFRSVQEAYETICKARGIK